MGPLCRNEKKYCLSLTFLCPEIIPGGLTPAAQPLDKVINKVFKGHFRDLYDLYIMTAPIGNTGNPQPPSRQLLSTYLGCQGTVPDSRRVGEEIMDRLWLQV